VIFSTVLALVQETTVTIAVIAVIVGIAKFAPVLLFATLVALLTVFGTFVALFISLTVARAFLRFLEYVLDFVCMIYPWFLPGALSAAASWRRERELAWSGKMHLTNIPIFYHRDKRCFHRTTISDQFIRRLA
jgi:hypothetical protein